MLQNMQEKTDEEKEAEEAVGGDRQWFRAGTVRCVRPLSGHSSAVYCVALLGKLAVSGSYDNTLKVWDVETGGCVRTLSGHSSPVMCVALLGRLAVSGSYDNTLKVWK